MITMREVRDAFYNRLVREELLYGVPATWLTVTEIGDILNALELREKSSVSHTLDDRYSTEMHKVECAD